MANSYRIEQCLEHRIQRLINRSRFLQGLRDNDTFLVQDVGNRDIKKMIDTLSRDLVFPSFIICGIGCHIYLLAWYKDSWRSCIQNTSPGWQWLYVWPAFSPPPKLLALPRNKNWHPTWICGLQHWSARHRLQTLHSGPTAPSQVSLSISPRGREVGIQLAYGVQ